LSQPVQQLGEAACTSRLERPVVIGRFVPTEQLDSGKYVFTISRLFSILCNLWGPCRTQHCGPATNVFILLLLVMAFFVDLVNVAATQVFLATLLPAQFAGPTAREQLQSV
jgi:hypothetical protein